MELEMSDQSSFRRLQTIVAYDAMIIDRVINKWQPYFINFMFNNIRGNKTKKLERMEDEVVRVYSTLVPWVVRKPKAPSWKMYKPILIGSPDLPVIKMEKASAWNLVVNDGWHFNACLLLPPENKCRLRGDLRDHFRQNRDLYYKAGHPLARIYAMQLDYPAIADYTLKHYKRGNVSSDNILVLPRHESEL
jgi:hypothetical protein